MSTPDGLTEHAALVTRLAELTPQVDAVARRLISVFDAGGRLYTLGNGGSAADASHLAEELVGRYRRERRPLPAQSLAADAPALTCIANDWSYEEIFERQVNAFVLKGDVVVGFSTSGRSPNVVRALAAARARGATTILFGGGSGGDAVAHADLALLVPSERTERVQEMHVLLLHLILEQVDAWAAG